MRDKQAIRQRRRHTREIREIKREKASRNQIFNQVPRKEDGQDGDFAEYNDAIYFKKNGDWYELQGITMTKVT